MIRENYEFPSVRSGGYGSYYKKASIYQDEVVLPHHAEISRGEGSLFSYVESSWEAV